MLIMKRFIYILAMALCISAVSANAQVKEDFKPAPNVQPGKQYPQVNSERCVRISSLQGAVYIINSTQLRHTNTSNHTSGAD